MTRQFLFADYVRALIGGAVSLVIVLAPAGAQKQGGSLTLGSQRA